MTTLFLGECAACKMPCSNSKQLASEKSARFYRAMLRRARLCRVCPSVRLSVRPSVTFRYRDQIGWNSSKIISQPNSLPMRSLTPNMGDLVQREHPQN